MPLYCRVHTVSKDQERYYVFQRWSGKVRKCQEMSGNDHGWSGNGQEMMFCLRFLKIVPAFRIFFIHIQSHFQTFIIKSIEFLRWHKKNQN